MEDILKNKENEEKTCAKKLLEEFHKLELCYEEAKNSTILKGLICKPILDWLQLAVFRGTRFNLESLKDIT